MSKPNSKAMLLSESKKEHEALEGLLATLNEEQMLKSGIIGEWSIKDLLAHLYEWEQMVLNWQAAGEAGERPGVPAEGYKWSQLPALNEVIRQKHLARPLNEVRAMCSASYHQIMEKIETLSEEALFTPGLYPWMNKNSLAAYFTSCTSSHYRWARAEIRKGLREEGREK